MSMYDEGYADGYSAGLAEGEESLTEALEVVLGLGIALREAKYQLNQGQNSSYVVAHIDRALESRS